MPEPGEAARPQCFVIMPFGGLFDDYYREIISEAVADAGLTARRSDEVFSQERYVVEQVRQLIASATICVADITKQRPNVFYELGLADALECPVVLIAQSGEGVPAELAQRRILWYRPARVRWAAELQEAITASIQETLDDVGGPAPRDEPKNPTPGQADTPTLEQGEELLRDLLADGVSLEVSERLLIEAGLPESWVRVRLIGLRRSGW